MSAVRGSIIIAASIALAGCGSGDSGALTATEIGTPFSMPGVGLTAEDGSAFNLRERTAGKFVLMFFGYSFCPDVCPISMAVLNGAIDSMSDEERERVMGIFVTVDPLRDTPERLSEWLNRMGSRAHGLTGSVTELEEALTRFSVLLPPSTARRPVEGSPGEYLLPHPVSLYLVTPDGVGRYLYGFGRVTPDEVVRDIRLLAGSPPDETAS